jgi:murein DD-endopeptidase MepM/ murein hydrolase activator NlpD
LGSGHHHSRRTAGHRLDTVDFGDMPPIYVGGNDGDARFDRRQVSIRWLAGTVLTGVFGAALMGGAVFAALDGETRFATSADRYAVTIRSPDKPVTTRKSDRLTPVEEVQSARQLIRQSQMIRQGDREIVRVRPLTRLASNLAMSTTELSANIPAFNPQRLMAEPGSTATAAADDNPGAEQEADVLVVLRDLAGVPVRVRPNTTLAIDDVIAKVRDTIGARPGAAQLALGTAASGRLAFAAETPADPSDPYGGIDVRVVPENVSFVGKTTDGQAPAPGAAHERTVTVRRGDTMVSLLRENGATPEEARLIAQAFGARGREGGLRPDQKLRILLQAMAGSQRPQVLRVIVMGDAGLEAMVALSDTTGRFVAVEVQKDAVDVAAVTPADEEEDDGTGVRLYQSIYETGLRHKVPRPVIQELIRIYSHDIDFNRRVQPGDTFEVLYASEEDGSIEGRPEILFASLTVGGDLKRYYRFTTRDDGLTDYFDEDGKSAKTFLIRKPMNGGTFRSAFGMRRHPILGYSKMHTGVDWAGPIGMPIFAAGAGTVIRAGWQSGYGRRVELEHNNGYITTYSHLSGFARGLQPGMRVRQGQVVGFLGSSGLSTGPHLHYEVKVNDRFVDPMRIKLPRGRSLEGSILAEFERERDRVDQLMNRPTASRVAGQPRDAARDASPVRAGVSVR